MNNDTHTLETKEMNDDQLGKEQQTRRQPNILVIDDDPLFRAQTRRIAKQRNLPVTVCSSLHEMQVMSTWDRHRDSPRIDASYPHQQLGSWCRQ
jgi:DNA-binding response OmpR family regulator